MARDRPDLQRVFAAIDSWVKKNPKKTFLEPQRVVKESRALAARDVATALSLLAERGLVKQVYRVESPISHSLLDDEFDSPLDVPSQLQALGEPAFHTDEAQIVPVFKLHGDAQK